MQVTLEIDTKSKKAMALLNYLRELEFVSIKHEESISAELRKALDKGLDQLDRGVSLTNEDIVAESKQRYPNLFK